METPERGWDMLQDGVAQSIRVDADAIRNRSAQALACKRAGQYEDVWSDHQGIFPG